MDWFRWHHGSVTDPKFQLVARKAGATLSEVIAVWAYVLEHASSSSERGRVGCVDTEAWDCLFGFEEGKSLRIVESMSARGLIADGRVVRWEDRQRKRERDDDHSTERVKAYRERQATRGNATKRHETPRGEERREEEINPSSLRSDGARASKRCPPDFALTPELRAWAASEFPHIDVEQETSAFIDHTFSRAIKDWPATWRNWIRKADKMCKPDPSKAWGGNFPAETPYQRSQRERVAQFAPGVAAKPPGHSNIIDMEAADVTSRALG